MITVTLCHGDDGRFVSCRAKGHAGYAKAGNDIVCSASSILIRTLVLDLDEKARMNKDLCIAVECAEKGSVTVAVCECTPQMFPYLSFLFGFLKRGFESLSCEYPNNIRLEILNVS